MYQTLIENKGHKGKAENRQDFLGEKEVCDLLAENLSQLDDIDVHALSSDYDIPAYLRRIVIKHARPKSNEDSSSSTE